MLPKNKRVSKEVFSCILKKSKPLHSENLTLRVLKNIDKKEETKFSFVVSRKVSNKAPKRNLLKRRARFAVSKLYKSMVNGFICVFFVKKSAVDVSYSDLEKEIFYLLKKANVIL